MEHPVLLASALFHSCFAERRLAGIGFSCLSVKSKSDIRRNSIYNRKTMVGDELKCEDMLPQILLYVTFQSPHKLLLVDSYQFDHTRRIRLNPDIGWIYFLGRQVAKALTNDQADLPRYVRRLSCIGPY